MLNNVTARQFARLMLAMKERYLSTPEQIAEFEKWRKAQKGAKHESDRA